MHSQIINDHNYVLYSMKFSWNKIFTNRTNCRLFKQCSYFTNAIQFAKFASFAPQKSCAKRYYGLAVASVAHM